MKATKVNAGLAESNGRLLLGIWRDSLYVTCGLTACTLGSAPGPTLGNEFGKTFTFYTRTSQSVKHLIIGLFCFAVKLRCNKRNELLWRHFVQFFHKTYVMSITVKDASKLQQTYRMRSYARLK